MASKALFVLPLSLLLSGCDPKDPIWSVYCEDRPPEREVVPGTGETSFTDADAGPLQIVYGDQGGMHIWVALRLHNMGPKATAKFGIYDAENPETVYSGPNAVHVDLTYNPDEEASEAAGMFGYLYEDWDETTGEPLPGPSGRPVVIWADVTDECTDVAAHGEAAAEVQ